MPTRLDHLVIAGADLSALCHWWEQETGVRPVAGGAHAGMGTRNSLVGLEDGAYLELIGPDPDQHDPPGPRPFGIDDLRPSDIKLVTFALAVDDIEAARSKVVAAGVAMTPTLDMNRVRPDGVELRWRLTLPVDPILGGVAPFLIDWGSAPHPSAGLDDVAMLTTFTLGHPAPESINRALAAIGCDLTVDGSDVAWLGAEVVASGRAVSISS